MENLSNADFKYLCDHLFNPPCCATDWPVPHPQSYTLYLLQQNAFVPTAATLGINLNCTRSAPWVRAMGDYVLYAIAFDAREYCLYCAYTATKSGGTVFILWQSGCKKGVTNFLPREIFVVQKTLEEVETKEVELLESLTVGHIKRSNFNILTTNRPSSEESWSIKRDEDWKLLQFIFSPLAPDLDGLFASIANSDLLGNLEKKGQYLRIVAKWSRLVEEADERDLPCALHWLCALWLDVSGCPEWICSEEDLSEDVSNILRCLPTEDIPAADFVEAMEKAGYRRPFSRLVAKYLSSEVECYRTSLKSFEEFLHPSD
mmetsp:Transcript_4595/g.6284  ORF Transcript_4595/g.6284 Transcript_4595/m.6284 type:complete len:317 (-) Transcript_4595:1458-2408(-)